MNRREDEREKAEKLWDKTFDNNEDLDADGHLSRTEHRKQSSMRSRITTILVVLIIILAATPVVYWVNHERSFNHPAQTSTRVASSSSSKKKAATSSKHSSASKTKQASSSSTKASSANSVNESSVSSTSQSSSSSSASSSSSSSATYVTVESGQGIYRVATNNGLTVSELAKLNGISTSTKLYPGQKLRVK